MATSVHQDDVAALALLEKRLQMRITKQAQQHLLTYISLLRRWQPAQNLVSASTLSDVWIRHIGDALQMIEIIDSAVIRPDQSLESEPVVSSVKGVDLGTGAGLPGMILALATADRALEDRYSMTLVDANTRKMAFLRAVSRETNVTVDVRTSRIEDLRSEPVQFVSARALAPLPKLIALADPWLASGAVGVFHKGVESAGELAQWTDRSNYSVLVHPSRVNADSTLLAIRRTDTAAPETP